MRYMDYDKFKKEYEAFEEWNSDKGWEYLDDETPKNNKNGTCQTLVCITKQTLRTASVG